MLMEDQWVFFLVDFVALKVEESDCMAQHAHGLKDGQYLKLHTLQYY